MERKRARKSGRAADGSPDSAERLLAGALELFAARDFAAVTIKDIAKAAGVTTALIYYYYDDKEALFRASLEHAVARALDNYRHLRENQPDPVGLITDWLETNVQFSKPIRELLKIMLDYRGSRSQKAVVDRIIKQFYDEECSILSTAIRQGIEQGLFRPVDHDRAALFASTQIDGIFVRSMIHKNFDLAAGMATFKAMLWEHLGYRGLQAVRQPPGAQAG